jgi:gamma-glutamyltranspeptidase
MLNTSTAVRGIVTAPHHLASQAGLAVLRKGGNAIEAMVAAAAAVAVVYPHMNAIGGDGFWLVHVPGKRTVGIDACGAAGARVDAELYRRHGLTAVPTRGPLAANTVAGTISGWEAALQLSAELGGQLPLGVLLEDAIFWAEHGVPCTDGQRSLTEKHKAELAPLPGFREAFLTDGHAPGASLLFKQPRLATTLRALSRDGLGDFYRGGLARRIAADLAAVGSPIDLRDLQSHTARIVQPLSIELAAGTVYNLPPPTQGLATLMILGLCERLGDKPVDSPAYVHALVECTKQAFLVRDSSIADPAVMKVDPASFLRADGLAALAARIDMSRALPWPSRSRPGDTVWLGAIDQSGCAVSFIQSLYWEFGSGVVLPETGITWQNRGASFTLEPDRRTSLAPGRRPFHTLNPSLAVLNDGRTMAFGTMGGEGQPQTQAALYTRHVVHGMPLQLSITAPRWLLGRTWGAETTTLKLESRFDHGLVQELRRLGHAIELVSEFDSLMGHAGAVVRHGNSMMEGASDPRGDGCVAGF